MTGPENASPWRRPLLALGVLVAAALVLVMWWRSGRIVSTDDAYVKVPNADISSNIDGRVVAIAVHDNQAVRRGDLLIQLDDRAHRIALAAARAHLLQSIEQVHADEATYRAQLAQIAAQRQRCDYLQKEAMRRQTLVHAGMGSQESSDRADSQAREAAQTLQAAQQQAAALLAALGGQAQEAATADPRVRAAQAALDRAALDLSYTRILAPVAGVVAQVDHLQVGDYIKAATPLFALMSPQAGWIEANFKEDELTHLRVGQRAEVHLDIDPEHTWAAVVDSLAPATGSQFSLLPPENATGNWVKVVQRVPVRLRLLAPTQALFLRAGLSAHVSVDTGYRRHLFSGGEHGVDASR